MASPANLVTKKTTIEYRYDSGTSRYLYGLPEYVKVYVRNRCQKPVAAGEMRTVQRGQGTLLFGSSSEDLAHFVDGGLDVG